MTQGTAAKRLRMGSTGRDALKKSLFILRVFFFPHQKNAFPGVEGEPLEQHGMGLCHLPPATHPHGLHPPGSLQLFTDRDVTRVIPRIPSYMHTLRSAHIDTVTIPTVCTSPPRITCKEQTGNPSAKRKWCRAVGAVTTPPINNWKD